MSVPRRKLIRYLLFVALAAAAEAVAIAGAFWGVVAPEVAVVVSLLAGAVVAIVGWRSVRDHRRAEQARRRREAQRVAHLETRRQQLEVKRRRAEAERARLERIMKENTEVLPPLMQARSSRVDNQLSMPLMYDLMAENTGDIGRF